eukprot:5673067-Prymnesium_polylepis.1
MRAGQSQRVPASVHALLSTWLPSIRTVQGHTRAIGRLEGCRKTASGNSVEAPLRLVELARAKVW